MPRHREYTNAAERQAAYRTRHLDKRPARQSTLAILANSLHIVMAEAVRKDRCPLPHAVLGAQSEETMRNLIYYFDPEPDPVRYIGMEGKPKA